MATFLFDKIIFGPVKSRRLGISLGINLLPNNSKLCNFDCIYCECGRNASNKTENDFFHPRSTVSFSLYNKLKEMKENNEPLDVITYAGNGEPTMHPEFDGIIDDTIQLRNQFFPEVRIAVLSNSTLIGKPKVFEALKKVDENILKIDSAFPETMKLINNPPPNFSIEKVLAEMKSFSGKLIVQTMFLKGSFEGEKLDNSTDKEVFAWIELIKKVEPAMVMIYTIARDTPSPNLAKVPLERLNEIAQLLEKEGVKTQVSG